MKEVTAVKKPSVIMNKQLLVWAKGIETQRSQKAMLDSIQENKDKENKK